MALHKSAGVLCCGSTTLTKILTDLAVEFSHTTTTRFSHKPTRRTSDFCEHEEQGRGGCSDISRPDPCMLEAGKVIGSRVHGGDLLGHTTLPYTDSP
ncbi:hypothetical protein TRIUR3_12745 [Triticum urartu]|uniref:Uncharacterized protein n=1 Tax=Triticum urartu TaxID=4572 RepID=M8AMU7_TRIUA|nr:hypothetical protein TRIUR3_12745 [Triticum urartu]